MYPDGWGLGEKNKFNAIEKVNTKNFDILKKKYSLTKLFAWKKKLVCQLVNLETLK